MKKQLKQIAITAVMLILSSITNAQWSQIGQDIDGESAGDWSGYSVSLSGDGSVIAIGAYQNAGYNGDSIYSGHVRIYENISGTWTQLGTDIDGEAEADVSGYSVSLSGDGSVVAIGAYLNDGNGNSAGHVRIYENIAGTWTQIGSDIDGEAANDYSGISVALSADGAIVAIGAPYNSGNGTKSGHVRIYKNLAGTWTKMGTDIDGETTADESGWSVSLSADGAVVAIGAANNNGNDTTDTRRGHVRIYENIAGAWVQIGSDIDGEAEADESGRSVSLSADGTIVAIGAYQNDGNGSFAGHVRIYKNLSGIWTQIGSDIDGEAADDFSGSSVSLSADGAVVAIGAALNDGNGSNAGHVRIYKNLSGIWTQIANDIDGEAVDDQSGFSVSLSADGSIVAIGAPWNNANGIKAGHVRIYTDPTIGINELNNAVAISLYPNPTSGKITIQCNDMQQLELLDITGKTVYEQAVSSNMLEIDISTYSKGLYFIKVTTNDAVGVEQIVLE
jgi:Flp pilus assembly pilin Flp